MYTSLLFGLQKSKLKRGIFMSKTSLINNVFNHTSNSITLMYIGAEEEGIIRKVFNHSYPTIKFKYLGIDKEEK